MPKSKKSITSGTKPAGKKKKSVDGNNRDTEQQAAFDPSKDTVMFFGAHSDDAILGGGGAMAKYVKEGKNVISIIFSFGEKSHPWLKRRHTVEMRVAETKEAIQILGCSHIHFLALTEGRFAEEIATKGILDKLEKLVKLYKPVKILTHSIDDPHPDHRAVYKATMELLDRSRMKCDVYSYNIWNPANFLKRGEPKLVVDISDTFRLKIAAIRKFESQKIVLIQLIPVTFMRAIRNGWFNGYRFGETFIKVR